jgi:hypothetical protein
MNSIYDIISDDKIEPVWTRGRMGSLFTKKGTPSRYYLEGIRENIKIRVVIESAGEGIITAFPIY